MCLNLLFSHSKWVSQAMLSLTVFSICLLAVQTLIPFFSLTVLNFVVGVACFFRILDRKFNENSKNVVNIVIFSL